MNDQDRDEGEGNDPELIPAIESLDDYVRRYGLLGANDDDQTGGEFNGLNRLEAIKQVLDEEAYRDEVIEKHQASQHEVSSQEQQHKEREGVISLLLANKTTYEMPVRPLVAFSDTAERMVDSRGRYGIRDGGATNLSPGEEGKDDCLIEISLAEFDPDATMAFIGVLLLLYDHKQKAHIFPPYDGSLVMSQKRRMNDEIDNNFSNVCRALIIEGKIPDQHIVECLRLAHYLQCRVILETLTSILELSIDSRNCMAICSLADSLNLTSLFEASVNYVIERLDAFQGISGREGDPETKSSLTTENDDVAEQEINEVWTSLPYELRSRIMTMRNVMRSSVIGRGSKVSGLFFSSGAEFLAIFREAIRDQSERLAEAKARSEEVIRERTEQWVVRSQGRGLLFDLSSDAKTNFIHGGDVAYTLEKIEKQSRRLKTLESFYEEQKTIFEGQIANEILL